MELRENEVELDIREYIAIIRKRFLMILLVTIISVAGSGIVSFFVLEPVYQASTTVMVGKPAGVEGANLQIQDLNLNQRLARTYGEIVKSRTVSEEVIRQLDLGISAEQLKSKSSVNLVRDTEFITISVTDTDPEKAAIIANRLAEVFKTHVMKLMQVDNVQVLDKAVAPRNSIKPRPQLNMAIAAVLGLMLSLFAVFLLEYLDNTLKTPEDIQRHLGLNVIGTIPIMQDED